MAAIRLSDEDIVRAYMRDFGKFNFEQWCRGLGYKGGGQIT
jgi:hypothetical protein